MAKTNLLVDRYSVIGNARRIRIKSKGSQTTVDKFAGHPSLKKLYGNTYHPNRQPGELDAGLDRFRGAGARYYSFSQGASRKWYRGFDYLNRTPVGFDPIVGGAELAGEDRAWRNNNYIATNTYGTVTERGNAAAPTWRASSDFFGGSSRYLKNQYLPRFFGDPTAFEHAVRHGDGFYNYGDSILALGAHTQLGTKDYSKPYLIRAAHPKATTSATDGVAGGPGIRNQLTVYGDEGPWAAGAAYQGIDSDPSNNLSTLNGGSTATDAWYTYAQGPNNAPGGAPSMTEYKGFIPYTYKMYYDHAHMFVSPVSPDSQEAKASAGVKTATIETNYNYFSKNYENASATVSELLLPNRYIILDAIDRGRHTINPDPAAQLGDAVISLYDQVSCLDGAFPLPTTRDQISIGKGAITSQDPAIAQQALAYGSTKTYIQNFYSSLPSPGDTSNTISQIEGTVNRLTKHIGFTRDFIVDNFTNYNAEAPFPFGISIEFNTRQYGENNRIATDVLDRVTTDEGAPRKYPGAYELLLQYAMIMNISPENPGEWYQDPNALGAVPTDADDPTRTLRGNHLFENIIDFSAVLSQDAGTAYYGFDWASTTGEWGGATATDGTIVVPKGTNAGPYNLKALNLSHALAYAGFAAHGSPMPWQQAAAPSPLTGPTDGTGVAFGDGMLVGRKAIARHGVGGTSASHTKTWRVWQDNTSADVGRILFPSTFIWDAFLNDLRNVIVAEERSFEEMLHGDKAYCETIAFRVAKYRANAAGAIGDPIQNFYFPNVNQIEPGNSASGTLDKIKYIDTQVKYGEKYVYKIYAYNLVIGTQYHYTAPQSLIDTHFTQSAALRGGVTNEHPANAPDLYGSAKFDAHQFTSLQIIEAPYYTYKPVEVRDLPPVFPEVEVVPFKGVNNKIKLLLQTQNVKYSFAEPEKFKINDADIDKYKCIRSAQLGDENAVGPLVFGSDDTEITFEVYRMTEKPLSYVDFDGHLLASVPGVTPSGEKAVNIGYDDTIKPNRKYYYTFRTIDYHDAISIPSPIYQVEIVDDNGRMYPIVDVFYINNHVDRSVNVMKPLRKYIQISPAMAQIAVDMVDLQNENITPTEAPPPGLLGTRPQDGSVWQKELTEQDIIDGITHPQRIFKIRLTSRQTGKKIDLNVKFIQTSTINPEGLD